MYFFANRRPPLSHPLYVWAVVTTAWVGKGGSYVLQNRFHRSTSVPNVWNICYIGNFFTNGSSKEKIFLEDIEKNREIVNANSGITFSLLWLFTELIYFWSGSKHKKMPSLGGGVIHAIRLIKAHKICTLIVLRFDEKLVWTGNSSPLLSLVLPIGRIFDRIIQNGA